MVNPVVLSWLIIISICHFPIRVTCLRNHETINCTPKVGVHCKAFKRISGCDPLSLMRDFPALFPNTVERSIWPGSPAFFDVKLANGDGVDFPKSLILTWLPPSDSSIRDLNGFYITVTVVEGVGAGIFWCIVADIKNASFGMEDLNVVFNLTIGDAQYSTVYDFRLYSLPLVDPYFDYHMLKDMSLFRRLKTPQKPGIKMTSSDWEANITCGFINKSHLEIAFESPPKHFQMNTFDFVLMHQYRREVETVMRSLVKITATRRQLWNFTVKGKRNIGQYWIMLTPKDTKQDFLRCMCRNQYGCVSSCKTSKCYLNGSTTDLFTGEPGSLVSMDIYNNTGFSHLNDSEKDDDTHLIIMAVIVLAILIITSSVVAKVWCHYQKPRSRVPEQKPNNSEELTRIFQAENNATSQILEHDETHKRKPSEKLFIQTSSENIDIETVSLSLSEQMLEINESYSRQLKMYSNNQTGSTLAQNNSYTCIEVDLASTLN